MEQSHPYNSDFYDEQKATSLTSAEVIVPIILDHLEITSVLDVGCGVGTWMSVFQKLGITDLIGFDLNDLSMNEYLIEKSAIKTGCDLSHQNFKTGVKKDLTICLEVAEHLPETAADYFVKMLVSTAPIIIFSAADPGQTGVNHINERPPWYWREKFNQHGYAEIDFIRPLIWTDERISWWYRQNITCFANFNVISTRRDLRKLASRFLQKEGPHKLTLVKEWILKESDQKPEKPSIQLSQDFSRLLILASTIKTSLTGEEKATLFSLAQQTQGSAFVEIGSYVGASASILALALSTTPSNAKVYCVDTWRNEGMSEGSRDTYTEFLENTHELQDYLVPLRGTSKDVSSRYCGKVDFLFIGGDHLYEGVVTDIVSWFPKLRPGSTVVFHDIGWAEGIQRAFRELAMPFLEDVKYLPNMCWGRFKTELPSFSSISHTPLKFHFQEYYEQSRNPLEIENHLINAGVPFERKQIDIDDFKLWLCHFQELKEFYSRHGDVKIEKCLEHYLAYRELGLKKGDRYIDVAAASSKWYEVLQNKGLDAYALDLVFPKGLHGWQIGADASETDLPDGFATALSLQCAFETFEGDADTKFIHEAARVLQDGGRLAITPLYLENNHIVLSSPDTNLSTHSPDEGSLRVWRTDLYQAAFSRHYSAPAFVQRVGSAMRGFNYRIIRYTNLDELRLKYPGQRIYCDFQLAAHKTAQEKLEGPVNSAHPADLSKTTSYHRGNDITLNSTAGKGFISVIIPTRNRSDLLSVALKSLLPQTYPQDLFEVLVLDNASTDDTPSVSKFYQGKFNNFRYIRTNEPGLHVGRNAGLKHAKGNILVYADDDIKAIDTWLEGVAESFLDNNVALVTGKILPEFETQPPSWVQDLANHIEGGWSLGWYTLLDLGNNVKTIPHEYVWGANFAIRKNILLQVGGFHPDAFPQELIKYRGDGETAVSLAVRDLGYKALYNPKASVYHLVSKSRLTREYIYQRAYNQGISDSYTNIRTNRSFSDLKQYKSPANTIYDVVDRGSVDGFNYHQQLAKNDNSLVAWILKESYIDCEDISL
ncbi:MAG: glycosyltransferase [Geobacteraceae bacterium]|nr:glycosyltransferase [Geobacteraceae bacterium]